MSVDTLPLPTGLKNQSKEESNYLKLHKCQDVGEAYSASYLITKEHLLNQFTGYNLTWVNCEMGSFIMMNQRARPERDVNGSVTQTLDVLDFSIIHLSWYERLQKRHARIVRDMVAKKMSSAGTSTAPTKDKADDKGQGKGKAKGKGRGKADDGILDASMTSIGAVEQALALLKERALRLRQSGMPLPVPELNRTVAIMPFLGSDMGAGHSKLGNRLVYLQACFWSIYAEIPHVVAAVKSEKDAAFARNDSGLPFYDVMVLSNLPKSASLPVATVQQTKARLADGRWDFDYVYFTESDQILMMRIHDELYAHLKRYPRRLILPHRLNPYPSQILTGRYDRPLSTHQPLDWTDMNCCLQRQNCNGRKEWMSITKPTVPVLNIFGLQVALGNVNFHEEIYRPCQLNEAGGMPFCP